MFSHQSLLYANDIMRPGYRITVHVLCVHDNVGVRYKQARVWMILNTVHSLALAAVNLVRVTVLHDLPRAQIPEAQARAAAGRKGQARGRHIQSGDGLL